MADLDYAFLADYAQIEGDKLSVIGGSFTHVSVDSTDGLFILSVAGRVRMSVGEQAAHLEVRLRGGDGAFEVGSSQELAVGPTAKPYGDDKVGILFVSGIAVPALLGLYEVFLTLNGVQVRRLAFDIALNS
jgi:hypothetical protein